MCPFEHRGASVLSGQISNNRSFARNRIAMPVSTFKNKQWKPFAQVF
jgi:hypothetical protein